MSLLEISNLSEKQTAEVPLDFQLEDHETLNGFDYMVGGFAITVKRKQVEECYTVSIVFWYQTYKKKKKKSFVVLFFCFFASSSMTLMFWFFGQCWLMFS